MTTAPRKDLLLTATVVAAALRFYLRYRRHQPSPLSHTFGCRRRMMTASRKDLLLTATVVAAALRFYLRYRRHHHSPLSGLTFWSPHRDVRNVSARVRRLRDAASPCPG